jgi:hypothetical protein
MKKALSVTNLAAKKYQLIPFTGAWYDAFGTPQAQGAWLIWGPSTNGKTAFTVQLIRELAKHFKVIHNSLEEGYDLSMQDAYARVKTDEVKRNIHIISESMDELSERLAKPKSPHVVVIDSFQYTDLNFKRYMEFRNKHPNKLLIFTSHADGKEPEGRAARQVKYNVGLKIWVQGYKAFSQGRSIGPTGNYTIYEKGAKEYWDHK